MPPRPATPAAVLLAPGPDPSFRSRQPTSAHLILGLPLALYAAEACRAAGAERILLVTPAGEPFAGALDREIEIVPAPDGELLRAAGAALGEVKTPVLLLSAAWVPSGAVIPADPQPDAVELLASTDGWFCGAWVPPSLPLAGLSTLTLPDEAEVDLEATLSPAGFPSRVIPLSGGCMVRTRSDLTVAAMLVRDHAVTRLQDAGVTVEDPGSTWISPAVSIGMDSVIRPNSRIEGETQIGSDCIIGPNVQITGCRIGTGVTIHNAVLAESELGDGTRVGPYAQLRPGCVVRRNVKIGNFVELKNAHVDDRVSLGHFAYIGDAEIGEATNIGAGTITCNYDGKKKHRTVIGKHAFVGTHATLVAPVRVGDGAFVAAASVITQDVPEEALAVARSRQTNREGWARRRREAQELAEASTGGGHGAE